MRREHLLWWCRATLAAMLLMVMPVLASPSAQASLDHETGTASVSGRISAPAGHSVKDFTVRAFRRTTHSHEHSWPHVRSARTDATGRWSLDSLAAGTYRVQITSTEYLATGLVDRFHGGQASPWTAQDVVVADGATVTGVNTLLAVGGTVQGTVRSEHGEILVGARVLAYEGVDVFGTGTLDWQLVRGQQTGHDGRYVLDRLRAAPHLIYYMDSLDRGYLRQYHPGVSEIEEATVLDITAGGVVRLDPRLTGGPAPVPKKITRVKAPKASGKPRVGRTLKVTRGKWKPGKVTVKFRWQMKKGKKVVALRKAKGAKKKLKLTKGMRGKRYRVVVTVSRAGHKNATFKSKWSKKVRRR